MTSPQGNKPWGGPWGRGSLPLNLAGLIGLGLARLKQILPGSGPGGAVVLAVLLLIGLGAWTAYYTVPSDSVAVVQRFG
ncbi:MAG: hypothetical protein PVG22_10550, partial [Chromatiales bacterium]